MNIGVILSIASFVISSSNSAAVSDGPVVKVSAKRLERLSKGTNVCNWFRFPGSTTDEYYEDYISDSEMKSMRKMGIRHVRLCVAPQIVMDYESGRVKAREWIYVEDAIDRFIDQDIAVVLDIHNEDRSIENNPTWQTNFVRFWKIVSKRLKRRNPDMVFFEPINEPVFDGKESEWFRFNKRIVAAIRESAPKNTLIVSGPNWGGIEGLRKMKPLPDWNIVYSFHFYEPFTFTHQGAGWTGAAVKPLHDVPYPSSPENVAPLLSGLPNDTASMLKSYGDSRWSMAKMKSEFAKAVEWGQRNNVPLYCGEFGVIPKNPKRESRVNWFQDFGEILRAHKVGWAVWGWEEGFGLHRSINNGKIKVDDAVAKSLGLRMP